MLLGLFTSRVVVVAGIVGLVAIIVSAIAMAAITPLGGESRGTVRALLALLCIAGPVFRSYPRTFRRQRLRDDPSRRRLQWSGNIPLQPAGDVAELTDALRAALLERGATVAMTDGYQPYDLQVRTACCRVDINLLNGGDGRTVVGWKLGTRRAIAFILAFTSLGVILGAFDRNWVHLISGGLLWAILGIALSVSDARRIPPLLELAAEDVAARRSTAPPAAASAAL